jgi:plastocyanin
MFTRLLTAVMLAAVFAGCSGSSPTSPGGGGGGAGGGGDAGGGGGGAGGDPIPSTAAVSIGNDEFRSVHNGTVNTAVDTVAVGGTVTWTWTNTGNVSHSVQSLGTTIFRNSTILSGNGTQYSAVFHTAGTYEYDCAVHGAAMTGRIVVR